MQIGSRPDRRKPGTIASVSTKLCAGKQHFHAIIRIYRLDNGTVDAADYVFWCENVGASVTLPNDPIGGQFGQPQYDQWKSHFGTSSPAGNAIALGAIPEPITLMLIGCLSAGLQIERGRRENPQNDARTQAEVTRESQLRWNWVGGPAGVLWRG
jgi:hypothetical protein